MNPKLKTLENLILEAAKQLKKHKDENKKLSIEVKNLAEENARLQAKLREQHGLAERQKKVKARIEKLVGFIEQLEGVKEEGGSSASTPPAAPLSSPAGRKARQADSVSEPALAQGELL